MNTTTDLGASFAEMVLRIPTVALVAILLVAGGGCKDKSPATAPSAQPQSNNNVMFQNLNQTGGVPLPPPDTTESQPNSVEEDIPELTFEKSPECKALEAEQKKIRDQIDRVNKELVAPAAAKAETAQDAFNECQDDIGCVNNLNRYEARNRAYQDARNALKRAEQKVEELETQLYNVNHKISAKCDTSPL